MHSETAKNKYRIFKTGNKMCIYFIWEISQIVPARLIYFRLAVLHHNRKNSSEIPIGK
jgi:hypothetical protein